MARALRVVDLRGGSRARALRGAAAAVERDGAAGLDGLFPLPLLRRVRDRVLRLHGSGALLRRGLVRDVAGRYAATLPFEGPFLEPGFYANPALLELMGSLLGSSFRIGSLEAVIARPGAYGQHLHVDGTLKLDRVAGGRKRHYRGDLSRLPPFAVTLSVPLCDVDESNGPTAVHLGSHRAALLPRPPGDAEVRRRFPAAPLAGPFGRSFLFDYRVFHGGTPNMSREPRPLLVLVFVRSWYRDHNLDDVRPRLLISPRDLARVPERRRPLFHLAPAARRALWT